MINLNVSRSKCLILSRDCEIQNNFESLLHKLGYSSEFETNRKSAISGFLQNKHALVILDADFLPKNTNKVIQLFKMAHRSPGIVILKNKFESIGSYSYVTDGIFTSIDKPIRTEELVHVIKRIEDHLKMKSKILFLKDVLVNVGFALPLVILLTYLVNSK